MDISFPVRILFNIVTFLIVKVIHELLLQEADLQDPSFRIFWNSSFILLILIAYWY